ncbi:MAG: succinate--CoA ligase subunit alpha [Candidatus Bathyarchaeota archaeon]|nr:succinate--CoA ligase subunit alpha [Candidatus Bathyarchaeota archaeon]MDH5745375.1 succinate--CoA ligase subunit alpha [Candidatus Bathyarchaeota archaeon]
MCIFVDENTRTVVQGITGNVGEVQTKLMLEYGSKIVAGVTPGKGGMAVHSVPVYDNVKEAVAEHAADASILFVPPLFAKDAVIEAIDSDIKLLVVITEHIPIHDTMYMREYSRCAGARMIGPTTPGIICPGKTKIGITPANVFLEGNVGIISRSGTLLYEIAGNLSLAEIGQSSCLGIGADPVIGTDMKEILELFEKDEQTKLVVIVGEIGGVQEEEAAKFIKHEMSKPVIAYVAGKVAPREKKMGHAGAIILGEKGTAKSKMDVLIKAGVEIANKPSEIAKIARIHL